MNIAIFTNNYLPNPYGVSMSIESFCREFENHGHTVYIFAPKFSGYVDENKNARLSGRQVFRYPAFDVTFKNINYPIAIPFYFKINKILNNLDIDIIHAQHPNLLGSAAKKWAKKKKVPLVFTWHTLYDQYAHFVPLISKKWAAKYIIQKAVKYANRANFVITPTESVKEIVKKWGVINKNIQAIPSGVDENNFIDPDRNKIREKYGIKGDEALLFSVCRLTEEKNVKFLFEAVIEVLKSNEKTKFMIVSEGNLRDYLDLLVKKSGLDGRVIFAGIVAREEIKNYFAAGDIFVYASKSETQGMIISEAMYVGLPIVAVGATGSKDLVENNANGFLVVEDKKIFAEAVSRLVQDKKLRSDFSEKSKAIAREKYTDKICAEKMLEVYDEAIKLRSMVEL